MAAIDRISPAFRPPASRIRSSSKAASARNEASWTASRCTRLLRPLSSKLEALRITRNQSRCTGVEAGRSAASGGPGGSHAPMGIVKQGSPGKRNRQFEADDNWIPGKASKGRSKFRYSTKAPPRRAQQTVTQAFKDVASTSVPGLVNLATPVIQRVQNFDEQLHESHTESPTDPLIQRPDALKRHPNSNCLAHIIGVVDRDTARLYEGVYTAFESLIKATSGSPPAPRLGTRTLFSSCLRAVPDALKERERWQEAAREESPDGMSAVPHNDFTSETYTELESMGVGGEGWRPLQLVVRAHGVSMLCDAIESLLVYHDFAEALVLLCLTYQAKDAAQRLLSSIITVCPKQRDPSSTEDHLFSESQSLVRLQVLRISMFRDTFRHRQLGCMIRAGQISPHWLATHEMVEMWPTIIDAATSIKASTSMEAAQFIRVALGATSGSMMSPTLRPRPSAKKAVTEQNMSEALDNTVKSVLASLCALAILSQTKPDRSPGKQRPPQVVHQLLHMLAIDVDDRLHVQTRDQESLSTAQASRALMISYAYSLVSAYPGTRPADSGRSVLQSTIPAILALAEYSDDRDDFNDTSDNTASAVQVLAGLTCSIARCCGRATSDDGFEILRKLVHMLLEVSRMKLEADDGAGQEGWKFKEIGLQSALLFAEQSSGREIWDWVADLEKNFARKTFSIEVQKRVFDTSKKDDGPPSYRWEEGLCEWIAATPGTGRRKKRSIVETSTSASDESEPPTKKSRCMRKVASVQDIADSTTSPSSVSSNDEQACAGPKTKGSYSSQPSGLSASHPRPWAPEPARKSTRAQEVRETRNVSLRPKHSSTPMRHSLRAPRTINSNIQYKEDSTDDDEDGTDESQLSRSMDRARTETMIPRRRKRRSLRVRRSGGQVGLYKEPETEASEDEEEEEDDEDGENDDRAAGGHETEADDAQDDEDSHSDVSIKHALIAKRSPRRAQGSPTTRGLTRSRRSGRLTDTERTINGDCREGNRPLRPGVRKAYLELDTSEDELGVM